MTETTRKVPVLRFAPSPNGYLHLGHAYSALETARQAKQLGGTFVLRIEDIDVGRSREKFIEAIDEDLAWLGIVWPQPVLRQSTRFDAYKHAVTRLKDLDVVYPCAATRSEILAAVENVGTGSDPDGSPLYPGRGKVIAEAETEARIASGEPFALRIDIEKACRIAEALCGPDQFSFVEFGEDGTMHRQVLEPMRWGDTVIVRKDIPASYHLAVVVDDAFQGITHVTRGRDLRPATDIQRVLQILLDLPEPIYSHHRLILDDSGKKLSKSDHATSLQSLRAAGTTVDEINAMIGFDD